MSGIGRLGRGVIWCMGLLGSLVVGYLVGGVTAGAVERPPQRAYQRLWINALQSSGAEMTDYLEEIGEIEAAPVGPFEQEVRTLVDIELSRRGGRPLDAAETCKRLAWRDDCDAQVLEEARARVFER